MLSDDFINAVLSETKFKDRKVAGQKIVVYADPEKAIHAARAISMLKAGDMVNWTEVEEGGRELYKYGFFVQWFSDFKNTFALILTVTKQHDGKYTIDGIFSNSLLLVPEAIMAGERQ